MFSFNKTSLEYSQFKVLIDSGLNDAALKNAFTSYILIIFYSELEEHIQNIIKVRITKATDNHVSNFISKKIETIINRVKKGELRATLLAFDMACEADFVKRIDEQTWTKYSNFIINRHKVAHPNTTMSLSWEDLEGIADIGEQVIEAFNLSINLGLTQ